MFFEEMRVIDFIKRAATWSGITILELSRGLIVSITLEVHAIF
jgi:hypothetical protein